MLTDYVKILEYKFVFFSFRQLEAIDVQFNDTMSCYSCHFSKNIEDGTIYSGDENCVSDVEKLDQNKVMIQREVTAPGGNIKVRNVCAIFESTFEVQTTVRVSLNGPTVYNSIHIYVFERSIWQLFEGSTMWDFEGKTAQMEEFNYNCGKNVTTCSTVHKTKLECMFIIRFNLIKQDYFIV